MLAVRVIRTKACHECMGVVYIIAGGILLLAAFFGFIGAIIGIGLLHEKVYNAMGIRSDMAVFIAIQCEFAAVLAIILIVYCIIGIVRELRAAEPQGEGEYDTESGAHVGRQSENAPLVYSPATLKRYGV